ncbi:MAG: DinB family protein [Balneolaceae bacterium]|nr:DinB family protein [Balneolaceae bacterium]
MEFTYQDLIADFEEAGRSAENFLSSLSDEHFRTSPAPGRWSPAECFDHLLHFNRNYLRSMREADDGLEPAAAPAKKAFRPRLPARWVVSFFEPPYKMKVKTLDPFKPGEAVDLDREEILADYLELQQTFIGRIREEVRGQRDLEQVGVRHPLFPWLRMSLVECYAVILAHQRRHLWQAQKALKSLKSIKS